MRIVKYPVATRVTPNGVTYHSTEVVSYLPNGGVRLNTGGWFTNTTKQRMNQYNQRGVYIFQRKGEWFASFEGKEYPYKDGMEFYPATAARVVYA